MKKLLISLLVTGVLIGAVYGAAASITIGGVDKLGSGSSAVVANPTGVSDVLWVLANDPTKVDKVTIDFDQNPGADAKFNIRVTNGAAGGGNTGCGGSVKGTATEGSGGGVSPGMGSATTPFIYTFDFSPDDPNAVDITCIDITYTEVVP